jgi:hypothetical protein
VTVDRRNAGGVQEIARAIRAVGDREAHHVVFSVEETPYFVQFTTDPGVFWGEVGGETDRHADALTTLGWRAPAGHIPNWFQYFHPLRKRDYRQIAELVLATFGQGFDIREGRVVVSLDGSSPASGPTFVPAESELSAGDAELLDMAERILEQFGAERHDTHVEVTRRGAKRHQVRIAVSAHEGTVSCAALHLTAVEEEVLVSALSVSDELDRVPYTYAVRTVVGHGDSLVLLSKFAVLPEHRHPAFVGMMLYTTIEPLVAAHWVLHHGH